MEIRGIPHEFNGFGKVEVDHIAYEVMQDESMALEVEECCEVAIWGTECCRLTWHLGTLCYLIHSRNLSRISPIQGMSTTHLTIIGLAIELNRE